ncbi:MAG: SDR family oxidoreductase [Mariprofundaceae bacterium]
MNVLITGANRGIGLEFCHHYLNQGAEVWACSRSGTMPMTHESLHCVQLDVSKAPASDFAITAKLPKAIHLLINNAGIYGVDKAGQSLEDIADSTMQEVFNVNSIGPLRVVQCLRNQLIEASGTIANISSKMGSNADNSSGGAYAYRAAKSALVIISKSMAVDLEPFGIHVITLHPGWVRTDMTHGSGLIDTKESVAGMTQVIKQVEDYERGAFIAFDGQTVPF